MSRRYYVESAAPVPAPADPAATANRRALAMGLEGGRLAEYLCTFSIVRAAEFSGVDTHDLWTAYLADPEADHLVAAYIEGVASAR